MGAFESEIISFADKMCTKMQTADGGRSAENTAKQHATQVKFLMLCYKPRNLEELLNPSEICMVVESRVNSGEW